MSNFISLIKKYRLDEMLYSFGNMSIKMFKDNNSTIAIPMIIKQIGYPKKVEIGVSIWDILEIEYIAVCNNNDYRSKYLRSDQEVSEIVNEYRRFENENSGSEMLKNESLSGIFKYIFGITSEQFLFHNMVWIFQSYNRNYHILKKAKTQIQSIGINIDEITIEKFGFTSDEFISLMLILFWLSMQHPDPLSAPEEMYMKTSNTVLRKKNLEKIVDYYSCSYLDIRRSPLKKQLLYSKPFIKTDRDSRYIVSSMHLIAMTLADGLYWIVRDYYNEKKSQKFINAFGYMFEDYLIELANRFLDKDQLKKLPQTNMKGADYRVEFDNAILLIEQKSALLGLSAKKQVPDLECIDKFYTRNIIEAYEQIQSTIEGTEEEKPILKIILLYENFFNTGLIESSMPEIFEKDRSCWIMTIRDFETLLVTNKKDYVKCSEVISKLLTVKQEELNSSQSVLSLLDDMNLLNNVAFEGDFDYFQKAMEKLKYELNER
jgi:hypothetical protein